MADWRSRLRAGLREDDVLQILGANASRLDGATRGSKVRIWPDRKWVLFHAGAAKSWGQEPAEPAPLKSGVLVATPVPPVAAVPPTAEPTSSGSGKVVAVVVVLALVGVGYFLFSGGSSEQPKQKIPAPTTTAATPAGGTAAPRPKINFGK